MDYYRLVGAIVLIISIGVIAVGLVARFLRVVITDAVADGILEADWSAREPEKSKKVSGGPRRGRRCRTPTTPKPSSSGRVAMTLDATFEIARQRRR
jgi:hypothetical protein